VPRAPFERFDGAFKRTYHHDHPRSSSVRFIVDLPMFAGGPAAQVIGFDRNQPLAAARFMIDSPK